MGTRAKVLKMRLCIRSVSVRSCVLYIWYLYMWYLYICSVFSDLLAQVPYLCLEVGLGCRKLLDVMQVVPILWVPQHNFPHPAGPSEAARLSDCLGCAVRYIVTYACSVTPKNQPFSWQEMQISHLYQLVTLN